MYVAVPFVHQIQQKKDVFQKGFHSFLPLLTELVQNQLISISGNLKLFEMLEACTLFHPDFLFFLPLSSLPYKQLP